jgi:short-subunit dehydrogenase
MFETNVFGLAAMMRRVLPGMRERRRGHIVNVSSIAGMIGNPGSGYYCATKFAVEGLSQALAKEVAPLGIRVTLIEPGPFRTDFQGRSMTTVAQPIDAYAAPSLESAVSLRASAEVASSLSAPEAQAAAAPARPAAPGRCPLQLVAVVLLVATGALLVIASWR